MMPTDMFHNCLWHSDMYILCKLGSRAEVCCFPLFCAFLGSCAQDVAISWKLTSQKNNSYFMYFNISQIVQLRSNKITFVVHLPFKAHLPS